MTLRAHQELAHNKYLSARRMLTIVNGPQFAELVTQGKADFNVANMIRAGDCPSLEDLCAEVYNQGDMATLTLRKLRDLASAKRIPYYGRMNRVQLLQALQQNKDGVRNEKDGQDQSTT